MSKVQAAIEASIALWEGRLERHLVGKVGDDFWGDTVGDCQLCIYSYEQEAKVSGMWPCDPCPLRQTTGKPNCRGTPYYEIFRIVNLRKRNVDEGERTSDSNLTKEIEEMIKLLKDLR